MAGAKILIVEDEVDTIEVVKNSLGRFLDCEIDAATDGETAITKILEDDFDLVILDIKMPGLSGIDVLRKVKLKKALPDILVITAWDSTQVAEEVVKEGALDYIPKPITVDTLKLKMKTILEKKGKYSEKS